MGAGQDQRRSPCRPRPLVIQALSGLETELAEQRIDLTGQSRSHDCGCRWRDSTMRATAGQLAGNTHLHLMKLEQAAGRSLFARSAAGRRTGHRVPVVSRTGRRRPRIHQQQVFATRSGAAVARARALWPRPGASPQLRLARRRLRSHPAVGYPLHHSAGEHRPGHHEARRRRAAAASRHRRGPLRSAAR